MCTCFGVWRIGTSNPCILIPVVVILQASCNDLCSSCFPVLQMARAHGRPLHRCSRSIFCWTCGDTSDNWSSQLLCVILQSKRMHSSNGEFLNAVIVIQPNLPLPWLTTPPCVLIALNLFMHYYYVCTVLPGFVQDEVSQPKNTLLWASRSPTSPSSGVRWSNRGIVLLRAGTSKCRKCGVMRPEVSASA
jgi:hypothetical protein